MTTPVELKVEMTEPSHPAHEIVLILEDGSHLPSGRTIRFGKAGTGEEEPVKYGYGLAPP